MSGARSGPCDPGRAGRPRARPDLTKPREPVNHLTMRRSLRAALLAGWLTLCGHPASALDGPGRLRVEGVVSDDVLFLRQRPDANAPQVGSLPPNAGGVENLGCVTVKGGQTRPEANIAAPATWCRVRFRSAEGFANARFLRADAAAAQPAEIGSRIAEAEQACRGRGRAWKPNPAFAQAVDLGAGRQGWLLSDRSAGCGEDGRALCDRNLCRLQVFVARGDGSLNAAFDGQVLGHRLREVDGRPVLQVNQRGAPCGDAGVDECWRALELSGDALVPVR